MANKVTITRTWPDGDRVAVVVEAESAYPDALDQARGVAVRGFSEAVGATISSWTTDTDEDD